MSVHERFLAQLRRLRNLGDGPAPFEAAGVTSSQLELLDWLHRNRDSSLKDIADGLGVSSPNISVAIRKLEDGGLVSRRPDPDDGRGLIFTMTPEGKALMERVIVYRTTKAETLLAPLTGAERETLVALLEKAMGTGLTTWKE